MRQHAYAVALPHFYPLDLVYQHGVFGAWMVIVAVIAAVIVAALVLRITLPARSPETPGTAHLAEDLTYVVTATELRQPAIKPATRPAELEVS